MDLLLWRHAEALDASDAQPDDMLRPLSPRGIKQAQRMAKWLDQHMPEGMRILSSPALRCESTAAALGRKYKLCPELKPDAGVESLLEIAGWPDAKTPVLIIGHQPTLGQVVTHALHVPTANFSVRKGSVWWLRNRWRMHEQSAIVHCVQTPELLW